MGKRDGMRKNEAKQSAYNSSILPLSSLLVPTSGGIAGAVVFRQHAESESHAF